MFQSVNLDISAKERLNKKIKCETMTMNDINWEEVAKSLLQQEELLKSVNYPKPISILVEWKDNVYIGSIQEIVPESSKEIVVLSKSSSPLPNDLVNAIRKLDKERLELYADDSLDLDGRQHILRRLEDRLVHMMQEQTIYMMKHMPTIHEI